MKKSTIVDESCMIETKTKCRPIFLLIWVLFDLNECINIYDYVSNQL